MKIISTRARIRIAGINFLTRTWYRSEILILCTAWLVHIFLVFHYKTRSHAIAHNWIACGINIFSSFNGRSLDTNCTPINIVPLFLKTIRRPYRPSILLRSHQYKDKSLSVWRAQCTRKPTQIEWVSVFAFRLNLSISCIETGIIWGDMSIYIVSSTCQCWNSWSPKIADDISFDWRMLPFSYPVIVYHKSRIFETNKKFNKIIN